MENDSNITVTTTLGTGLNEEIQVPLEDYQPPAPPEAETITTTTTDSDRGLRAEDGVPVKDSSLADYREVESGDVRVTSYEAENSSRHRLEESFEQYQADLERLRFPEDSEFVQQLAESQGIELPAEPSPPPENMIPAEQVGAVVEQQVIFREHQQRMAQAMQNQEFVEYAAQAPGVDVEWDPAIGTAVAAAGNSPIMVAFLQNNPALAQQIASMPVPRALAEVSKLSAWLQVQLQQPQTPVSPPPRRVSTAPAPIKPLGGNPTATTVVDVHLRFSNLSKS